MLRLLHPSIQPRIGDNLIGLEKGKGMPAALSIEVFLVICDTFHSRKRVVLLPS